MLYAVPLLLAFRSQDAPIIPTEWYQWDVSATAGIQDGTGTWDVGTTSNWTQDYGDTRKVFANGNIVRFGGGLTGAGGTITISGSPSVPSMIFVAPAGGGNQTVTGGTLTLTTPAEIIVNDAASSAVISTPVGGTAGLLKSGVGTLELAGTNTYTGNTQVNGGTLKVSGSLDNGTTLTLSVAAGCTYQVSSSDTIAGIAGSGTVLLDATRTLTLAGTGTYAFNGALTGSGNLIKTTGGTLELTGTHTHSGTLTISDGTVGGSGSATSAAWVVSSSGNLRAGVAGAGGNLSVSTLNTNSGSVVSVRSNGSNVGKIIVGGNWTGPGAVGSLTVNLPESMASVPAGDYAIIDAASSSNMPIIGGFSIGTNSSGRSASVARVGNDLILTIS